MIDDSGDRKDGTATANVGRQWLGRLGKTDNGIVTVTTVWTDGRVYYPLHAHPYPCPPLRPRTFRSRLPHETATVRCSRGPPEGGGLRLPGSGRRLRLLRQRRLVSRAARGRPGLRGGAQAAPRYLGPSRPPHTPTEAAQALTWRDARRPGDWTPVERHFRDGHTETWWAADARLGGYGPDSLCQLVVATTDPARLLPKATWYLATNLPHPDAPHAATGPHPPADLAEIVRLYGLWPWIEQSYKQIKDELGWADFQVRSDRAIRRHQTLVNCAFSFCWDQWFAPPGHLDATAPDPCPDEEPERGTSRTLPTPTALLAQGITFGPRMAHTRRHPEPMVPSLDGQRPACRTPGPDQRSHHRTRH